MPISLSIKNAPDDMVRRLKERAARNHRSLQGEIMAILEEAAKQIGPHESPLEIVRRIRQSGLSTPSESADIIRHDRDTR